jgi:hypothetical protein
MRLRRTSRKRRLADAATNYLKFKTIAKGAKAVRKAVTGLGPYKAAKKAPTPVKALPVVAGVGAAGAVAARKRRQPESTPA